MKDLLTFILLMLASGILLAIVGFLLYLLVYGILEILEKLFQ